VGIGVSVFLLAVGAVLAFAVHPNAPSTNLSTVGTILMIAGGIGLLIASAVAAAHRRGTATRERMVERDGTDPARGG
jgi:hypothetical protein